MQITPCEKCTRFRLKTRRQHLMVPQLDALMDQLTAGRRYRKLVNLIRQRFTRNFSQFR
ncbi:Uncharacterised protein [Serratia marcescens]|uniref:Uncharacterized protein n=1 Tax=Serratia marcescens TaxID=615 RepID=A0A379Y3E1_SERMA|nr:Uncharacterised protein [Serratia marcescens]